MDKEGTFSWCTYAKNVAEEIGVCLDQIKLCTSPKQKAYLKKVIKKETHNYYNRLTLEKLESQSQNNKIFLYKNIKQTQNQMEYYLTHPNKKVRQNITKFRISDHNLLIERGRYFKIPRDQRLCEACNIIDDEPHFFFNCKINDKLREILMKNFIELYPNFSSLNSTEKLSKILNPSTPDQIRTVASFIEQSLELRKGDPT